MGYLRIKLCKLAVLLSGGIMMPAMGYCWSNPGHEAVALAAMQMLDSATAAKMNAILNGESVTNAAIWLDRVRDEDKFTNSTDAQEAKDFRKAFPGSSNWHFCDFIIGSTSYDMNSKYASTNDAVHGLELAIDVLEGKQSQMTKQEALRVVIHLVGDLHQPLHCGTQFYKLSTSNTNKVTILKDAKVTDPATATQDRGGNQLFYTNSEELHHMWDATIPGKISGDIATLATDINPGSLATPAVTAGDYHHWAESWAGETMQQATVAYTGIKYKSWANVPKSPGSSTMMLDISIDLPNGTEKYVSNQKSLAQEQLTKASVRLAQLLEKIQFN